MAVFVRVVECVSFKRAAESLALSPSVVSHHVRQLEERIGKPLIYRNTRNLALTADGHLFFTSAKEMLAAAARGFDDITSRAEISGELRVALPTALSRARFFAAIADFETTYPDITLSLGFSDRLNRHFEEGYDVALTFEPAIDRSLTARKLADVSRLIIASEAYLQKAGIPEDPASLAQHNWIWLNTASRNLQLVHRDSVNTEHVTIAARMLVDNSMACRRLALEGLGLAIIPDFVVEEDIAAGRLVRVLPHWSLETTAVFATWPKTAMRATLTHLFVDFFSASLAKASMG